MAIRQFALVLKQAITGRKVTVQIQQEESEEPTPPTPPFTPEYTFETVAKKFAPNGQIKSWKTREGGGHVPVLFTHKITGDGAAYVDFSFKVNPIDRSLFDYDIKVRTDKFEGEKSYTIVLTQNESGKTLKYSATAKGTKEPTPPTPPFTPEYTFETVAKKFAPNGQIKSWKTREGGGLVPVLFTHKITGDGAAYVDFSFKVNPIDRSLFDYDIKVRTDKFEGEKSYTIVLTQNESGKTLKYSATAKGTKVNPTDPIIFSYSVDLRENPARVVMTMSNAKVLTVHPIFRRIGKPHAPIPYIEEEILDTMVFRNNETKVAYVDMQGAIDLEWIGRFEDNNSREVKVTKITL